MVRNRIADIFDAKNNALKNNEEHRKIVLFTLDEIEMQLPVNVGDYTDFFSSIEHATNVGTMFKGKENALMQIGYIYRLGIMVEVVLLYLLVFLYTDLKVRSY